MAELPKKVISKSCLAQLLCVTLLAGCSSGPPIDISDIGNTYKGLSCDYDEPACQKDYEKARDEAAKKMNNRELEPFIAQVTSISESSNAKNTWDVNARIAWDQADENSSAMFQAGLLTGLITLGQEGGSLVKDSLKQPVGKCLTSPNLGYKGVAAMDMVAYEVQIKDLSGIKEGSYIWVSGGKAVPMGKEDGWLKTTYSIGSNNDFGKISLGVNKPNASLWKVSKLYQECPSSR